MSDFDQYVKHTLAYMQDRMTRLETELREIRELVTPLDPGSLPAKPEGSKAE